ncbi:hypothetical protein PFICI_02572 [Pestalotiopsis fici W106-1]|uniref:F-box domain-containing protein n=1 Tax=Pestalotiopsis fici (strain W106-1 / CGMCC3.15140) TaxID=1229662 RepID=W3XGI4_PESFW|nr:uncharacterized protein PFICI_02572 [Pestalotiopsis fici W106-1]ETS84547.1 hypothetical protein PFICI_02572 [Pestalotiopsis fici W106-1]
MDKLPTELMLMIFSHLSQRDAAKLRVVSRMFNAVGMQYSHQKLCIHISPGHMDKISKIANTKDLAETVRHLVISTNYLVLRRPLSWESYKKEYFDAMGYYFDESLRTTEKEVGKRYRKEERYNDRMRDIWGLNLDNTLRVVLSSFPKLKKLEIDDETLEVDADNPWQRRKTRRVVMRVNKLTRPHFTLLKQGHSLVMNSLFRIAGCLPHSLDTMCLLCDGKPRRVLPQNPNLLRSIRTLELCICLNKHYQLPFTSYMNLENLVMVGAIDYPIALASKDGTRMSQLKQLRLEHCIQDGVDFSKFLDLHTDTLECIRMYSISIDGNRTAWEYLYLYVIRKTGAERMGIVGAKCLSVPYGHLPKVVQHYAALSWEGAEAAGRKIRETIEEYTIAVREKRVDKINKFESARLMKNMPFKPLHCIV